MRDLVQAIQAYIRENNKNFGLLPIRLLPDRSGAAGKMGKSQGKAEELTLQYFRPPAESL